MMSVFFRLIFFALLGSATTSLWSAPFKKAILISVDGLRPDLLKKVPTPYLDQLISNGHFSTAKVVRPVKTLPNHASMISAVDPSVHEITWNNYQPERGVIQVPTLFALARQHGVSSAFIYGKDKLNHLNDGNIDHLRLPRWPVLGTLPALIPSFLGREAAMVLYRENPGFTFIHFPVTDLTGHTFTWGSCPQILSIMAVDRAIGTLIQAIKDAGQMAQTFWLITSDHGGHGFGHGNEDENQTPHPLDQTIPFVMSGGKFQGVRDDLTTLDIGPTIAGVLGLEVPDHWNWPGSEAFLTVE